MTTATSSCNALLVEDQVLSNLDDGRPPSLRKKEHPREPLPVKEHRKSSLRDLCRNYKVASSDRKFG